MRTDIGTAEESADLKSGTLAWSKEHSQPCRIIERECLWGQEVARVWLVRDNVILRTAVDQLCSLAEAPPWSAERVTYVAAAARLTESLSRDVLLAPIGAAVIPLPHQIQALERAMSGDVVRYLLASEVGLGKTIEAGLIARELKLRGLVKRILVLAPKGLVTQWVAEMETHFNERFRLVLPSDLDALKRISDDGDPWQTFDQVICPLDSFKPVESRRGWSAETLAAYNRDRFESLVKAGWDLVIIDEAHRLGGTTDAVARYKLGQAVASAAPYFLMLSATPHQGKSDAFHRLMALIDPLAFPGAISVTQEKVRPYVIRTEKRHAIDAQGQPLFRPRVSRLVSVDWGTGHRQQHMLYDAVTEYVRQGYNQAVKEKKPYIGFLMILMQRLVTSSTRAIRETLERRLAALEDDENDTSSGQMSMFPTVLEDEWQDLDGQEQVEVLVRTRLKALRNEREEVAALLALAKKTEAEDVDVKAQALVEHFYGLQKEEGDPDLKFLVFTEFVPTQMMLRQFLEERGFSVAILNGSMDMAARRDAQRDFANDKRCLVSTDAGGEGLNLQFAHIVFNFDVPWNPMRIEQRVGRVDRIGQTHTVRAFNFVLADTVEHRVRQVIEEKLQVILDEIGIDKTSDLLDSAAAGEMFDELYVAGLVDPADVEQKVANVTDRIRCEAISRDKSSAVLGSTGELNPHAAAEILNHPTQAWLERMVINYLRDNGGTAERQGDHWRLRWPDGTEQYPVAFTISDLAAGNSNRMVTMEDPRVRDLLSHLPQFIPGLPVGAIKVPDLPASTVGWWSLWQIGLQGNGWRKARVLPVFTSADGKAYARTAQHIWDVLLSYDTPILKNLGWSECDDGYIQHAAAGEQLTKAVYDELVAAQDRQNSQEREKAQASFASRREAASRTGLASVRQKQMTLLNDEEEAWRSAFESRSTVFPERSLLLYLHVRGAD